MAGGFTAKSTSGPWEAQKAPLKTGFARAESLYKAGPAPYYPGQTLADFDPATKQAQAATLGYATGPRAAAQQALAERQMGRTYDWAAQMPGTVQTGLKATGPTMQSMLAGTVNTGAGTPYGDMAKAYKDQVIGQLTDPQCVLANIRTGLVNYGQAGGSTRGNLLQQQAITDAVTKGMSMPLAQMYGNAYQTAQAGRLPAAQAIQQGYGNVAAAYSQAAQTGLAGVQQYPGIMSAPLSMYDAMSNVGADRRAMAQESINQAMQKYDYGVNAPQVALQNYMAGISGDYGSTQKARPSPMAALGQVGSFLKGLG